MSVCVGVLGGGQLGRMLADAAARVDVKLLVLDPNPNCSSFQVLPDKQTLVGDFRNATDIHRLVESCDILTYEIEHVDCHAVIEALQQNGESIKACPAPETIALIQDKFVQKTVLSRYQIPMPRFAAVSEKIHVLELIKSGWSFPMVLKSRRLAYDGKGNVLIHSERDIDSAFEKLIGRSEAIEDQLYVEEFVPFIKELAVMVAKSTTGEIRCYPVVETIQKDSVCHLVIAPAQIHLSARQKALQLARDVVQHLDGAGIYGVEMFLTRDGILLYSSSLCLMLV